MTLRIIAANWVDNASNWASVSNIDVGMYNASGTEVAHLDFAGPDTVQGGASRFRAGT
jgi:hypothetical protein